METPAETLSKRLPEIVRACRLGDYGDAASALNKCIPYLEGLQTEPALKAKKKPLEEMGLPDLGLTVASRTQVLKLEPPAPRKAGLRVKTVDELLDKLKNDARVL